MASKDEVRIDFRVSGEDGAVRDIKKVERAAEDAGDAIDNLGGSSTDAAKKTDAAGDKLRDTGDDASFLKKRVTELNAELKSLVERLDSTGDTSLEKDIRKTEREARKYSRLLKQVGEEAVTETETAAKKAGSGLVGGLADSFRDASATLEGVMVPIMIGLATEAAPGIGAVLGAAVLGGVGIGGIVGGVAAAVNDPFISEAAERLGGQLGAVFTNLGSSTFGGPLLETFKILETAGTNFASGIRPGLQAVAPLLTQLANGFEGMALNLLPGLNKALVAAKPIIRVIADNLPGIGDAISDAFSMISDNSDGAIMAMEQVMILTQGAIRLFGALAAALSKIFEWTMEAADAVSGFLDTTLGWIPMVGDFTDAFSRGFSNITQGVHGAKSAAGDFSGSLDVVGTSAAEAAAHIKELQDGIEELFGKTMSLEEANVAWASGMRGLIQELKDGPKTLELTTEAGIKHRQALDQMISTADRIRQANIDMGMPLDQANAKYKAQIAALSDLALKMGYSRTEIDKFINEWKLIPDQATKKFIFSFEAQSTMGATAWSMIRAAERQQVPARAGGGPTKGGQAYLVGENGPELWMEGSDGHIFNASQTRQMMSGASGGSAAGASMATAANVVTVRLIIDGTDEDMKRMIRKMVKVDGGGSVQVAFGEN